MYGWGNVCGKLGGRSDGAKGFVFTINLNLLLKE